MRLTLKQKQDLVADKMARDGFYPAYFGHRDGFSDCALKKDAEGKIVNTNYEQYHLLVCYKKDSEAEVVSYPDLSVYQLSLNPETRFDFILYSNCGMKQGDTESLVGVFVFADEDTSKGGCEISGQVAYDGLTNLPYTD